MIRFPFSSLQQLNLDWIMEQLHKILQFMPMNGVAGDVLQRNADGAVWQPITAISLDVHALNPITDDVAGNDELPIYDNDLQGNYKATVSEIMLQAPVQSVNGQTGDVVLTIPSIPVDSVNGQTGTVVLDASDVGALPDSTVIPENTSDLVNDSGFITAAGAPVQSVCSKVGSVLLDASDVGALPDTYVAPVTSVNGMTGDVIVSGGGGFSPTLLWTNASPTAAFADQTLPLDLTDYSWIIVEYGTNFYFNTNVSLFPVPSLTPPAGYTTYNSLFGLNASGSGVVISERKCQISTSGITFLSGTTLDTYAASSQSTNNQVCRPLRIWGIA